MKIGDAGEAFFVFETDEDIPDDLVTSPLLTATSTTPQEDISPVAFNSKSPLIEGSSRTEAKSDILEPEFLDLNATSQDETWRQPQRVQSATEAPSSDDANNATPVSSEGEGAVPSVEYRDRMPFQ